MSTSPAVERPAKDERINRPKSLAAMPFIIAIVAFAIFWVTTVLYVRAAHRLVHQLHVDHPGFWRDELESPRFVAHHRRIGLQFQFRFYLQPLLPFLRWVLAGSAGEFPDEIRNQHRRTKRLLIASALGFLVTLRLYAKLILGW